MGSAGANITLDTVGIGLLALTLLPCDQGAAGASGMPNPNGCQPISGSGGQGAAGQPACGAGRAIDLGNGRFAALTGPVTEFPAAPGVYCGLKLEMGTVETQAGAMSLQMLGSERGQAFRVLDTAPATIVLNAPQPFSVLAGDSWLLRFDQSVWLAQFDTRMGVVQGGTVVVSPQSGQQLLFQLRRQLPHGVTLHRDSNRNSRVDPEEPSVATSG